MLSFLGLRKEAKKSTADKETDGGFVIIGETIEEQRKEMQSMNIVHPSTNVIVQPLKSFYLTPDQPSARKLPAGPSTVETAVPDVLGDVPFTLAPHVLTVQSGYPLLPSRDINYNLANYQYDFTLENSVLHNA